jgi:hypothetical protein
MPTGDSIRPPVGKWYIDRPVRLFILIGEDYAAPCEPLGFTVELIRYGVPL